MIKTFKIISIFILLFVQNIDSQINNVFNFEQDITITSTYFSPLVKFSEIRDKSEVMMFGVKGVITYNNKIGIGCIGTILTSNNVYTNKNIETQATNEEIKIQIAYGGLIVEPEWYRYKKFHLLSPVIFGGGKVEVEKNENEILNSYYSIFWVIEPEIQCDFEILSFLRASIGISYRYAFKFDNQNLYNNFKESDFSRLSLNIGFKLGRF